MQILEDRNIVHPATLELSERVEYYLNHQVEINLDLGQFERVRKSSYWNEREMHLVSYHALQNSPKHLYCKYLVHLPRIRNIRVLPFYKSYKDLHSLMNFFQAFDHTQADTQLLKTRFPLFYGETGSTEGVPVIRKSRRADDDTSIIYNFRTLRLTQPCHDALAKDIQWSKKKTDVIWRGATTGKEQRTDFVKSYFEAFDVGFSSVKQKPELADYRKPSVSIQEQLQYKYIVSLEGNDVASNLRWILASNSVPIMKKPFWHSWIMESKLEAGVHYLELDDDLGNLYELMHWAENHDKECDIIARNGKAYMSQFLDDKKEAEVQKRVLEAFAARLNIKNETYD